MDLSDVKEIIKLINETDITEVSLESSGVKVAIKKGYTRVVEPVAQTPAPPAAASPREIIEAVSVPVQAAREVKSGLTPVVSPMVGTYYSSPSPDAPPFVKTGDRVHKGQTLCIIEAMKLMNEIESEVAGEVVEIMVENGQAVEYGQTLFLIRE